MEFDWRGRRVLVTGAGGFLGSHLVERLAEQGAKVRAFLRYTADKRVGNLKFLPPELLEKIDLVFGDITDSASVSEAVRDQEIVMHLAAVISIPYSIRAPEETTAVNVLGTLNILMAARERGAARVVVTSSSEVYGTARSVPMTEDHPKSPQSPYAASKAAADALAESFYHSYDLPVVILRPFNYFGPRQSDRAIIPTVIAQALWRDQIEVGATAPRRDFTYVQDVISAFLAAAVQEHAEGQTIHLGIGRSNSVADVIRIVNEILDQDKPVVTSNQRLRPEAAEVQILMADANKARAWLGWTPRTSFENGIRATIAWIKSHPELYHPEEYRV